MKQYRAEFKHFVAGSGFDYTETVGNFDDFDMQCCREWADELIGDDDGSELLIYDNAKNEIVAQFEKGWQMQQYKVEYTCAEMDNYKNWDYEMSLAETPEEAVEFVKDAWIDGMQIGSTINCVAPTEEEVEAARERFEKEYSYRIKDEDGNVIYSEN